MPKIIRSSLLVFLFGICPQIAQSASISIVVSDKKDKSCLGPDRPEYTQYLLGLNETLGILNNYFEGIKNLELYDAAIVNAGLRFCSKKERRAIFAHIIQKFDQPNPNRRALEVATIYYRSTTMKKLIAEINVSNSSAPHFKNNIQQLELFATKAWSQK